MKLIRLTLILFLLQPLSGCLTDIAKKENKGSSHEAYVQLGLEYLQNSDTVNAKDAFQKAIKINPNYADSYNGLGLTFQLESDDKLAEEYFRKASALAPKSAMIHNNLGAFLFSKKRYKEACKQLAIATEDPFYNKRSQAFENLGICYRQLQQNQSAKLAFRRALQITSFRLKSLIELSDLLLLDKSYEDANKYYNYFLKMIEEHRLEQNAKSLWVGIRLARHNGNGRQAATYILLLKNMYPNSEEFRAYEESVH